jgi:hypothetical protein
MCIYIYISQICCIYIYIHNTVYMHVHTCILYPDRAILQSCTLSSYTGWTSCLSSFSAILCRRFWVTTSCWIATKRRSHFRMIRGHLQFANAAERCSLARCWTAGRGAHSFAIACTEHIISTKTVTRWWKGSHLSRHMVQQRWQQGMADCG